MLFCSSYLQALSAAKLYPSALNIISSGFIQITWDFKLCYFVPLILKIYIQFKTDKIPITSLRIYILSLLKSMFRVFTPFFLKDYQYLIFIFPNGQINLLYSALWTFLRTFGHLWLTFSFEVALLDFFRVPIYRSKGESLPSCSNRIYASKGECLARSPTGV